MGYNAGYFRGDTNLPVEQLNWYEAVFFCNRLSEKTDRERCYNEETRVCDFSKNGFRLPTEAEWEYACRAGTTTVYYSGEGEETLRTAAWYHDNSDKRTHPVGHLTAVSSSRHSGITTSASASSAQGSYSMDIHLSSFRTIFEWNSIVFSMTCAFILLMFSRHASQEGGWSFYTYTNFPRDIAVCNDNIWCATEGGVVHWNRKTMAFEKHLMVIGRLSNRFTTVAIDRTGAVWFAGSQSVVSYRDGVWQGRWGNINNELDIRHSR